MLTNVGLHSTFNMLEKTGQVTDTLKAVVCAIASSMCTMELFRMNLLGKTTKVLAET